MTKRSYVSDQKVPAFTLAQPEVAIEQRAPRAPQPDPPPPPPQAKPPLPPETLSVQNYGLPFQIVKAYQDDNKGQLYEWQRDCLFAGKDQEVLQGKKNLIYCAPTSGGKTFVAELLMLRAVTGCRGKVLDIDEDDAPGADHDADAVGSSPKRKSTVFAAKDHDQQADGGEEQAAQAHQGTTKKKKKRKKQKIPHHQQVGPALLIL
eukprot:GSA120T00019534001.1